MADDKHRGKLKATLRNPSRRRFLQGVGAVGAGAALVDKLAFPEQAEAQAATAKAAAAGAKVRVPLNINGQKREALVEARTTPFCAPRDHLGPAGTRPQRACGHRAPG